MMKNLYYLLPADIQREIYYFLKYEDIKKIPTKFYDDENDVYWKMKVLMVTNKKTPEGTTHRDFYESVISKKFSGNKDWNEESLNLMVDNEFLLEKYINEANFWGYTALMWAAAYSTIENLKILLASGADVNYQSTSTKETALMWASAKKDDAACVKLLLDAGADVNCQSFHGETALIYATANGRIENAKTLLGAGTDVNLKNNRGETMIQLMRYYGFEYLLQQQS